MKVVTVGVDAPRVTADEAVELMTHHLQLAAMYFEATPRDTEAVWQECHRLIAEHSAKELSSDPASIAAEAWLRAIDGYYKKLERDIP